MKPSAHSKHLKSIEHRRKAFILKGVVAVLVCLIILLTIYFSKSGVEELFEIKEVKVSGKLQYTNQNDLNTVVTTNAVGKNLIILNPTDLKQDVLKNFFSIKDLKIDKSFPNSVFVRVVERVPATALLHQESRMHFLLDTDGYVLGSINPESNSYPVINYSGNAAIKVGEVLPGNIIQIYLRLLDQLREQGIPAGFVSLKNNEIEVTVKGNTLVIISLSKNITQSVILLKEVLAKYSAENIVLKKIDLRYDNVVVEY